jgi:hypothetical protein
MVQPLSLKRLTEDLATAVPEVDSQTTGQYGGGIGSEDEERQTGLLLQHLREKDERYQEVQQEVAYPSSTERCDLLLPPDLPVEVKLIRYWRANGDPEPNMYKHVFSPFHDNTLVTDANRLAQSGFGGTGGLLGLFYTRSEDDPETVAALPDRYTAGDIADKVVKDISYWYDMDVNVRRIASFTGLQHRVHKAGAVISWRLD